MELRNSPWDIPSKTSATLEGQLHSSIYRYFFHRIHIALKETPNNVPNKHARHSDENIRRSDMDVGSNRDVGRILVLEMDSRSVADRFILYSKSCCIVIYANTVISPLPSAGIQIVVALQSGTMAIRLERVEISESSRTISLRIST